VSQVTFKNIVKQYTANSPVIRGIDLEVRDGEFIVFVGPSGCGKSTMLRMIAGLEEITSGELYIGDKLANDMPPAKRGIAMVFQSYALYPHMSVFENMAFGLRLAGLKNTAVEVAVRAAAEILQIIPLLKRKPKELSGGERQRVAIGRAIVRKPEVFLFDEPLSNLDASLRVQMRIEITRLHQELKTTMIYVTHDQVEAMTLGERIAVFSAGRIEQVGTPLDLYDHPDNLFVAGFLGSPKMNFMDAEIVSASATDVLVRLPDGTVVTTGARGDGVQTGDRVTLGIRAEHIAFDPDAPKLSNMVKVQTSFIEHLGDISIVYARMEGVRDLIAFKQPFGALHSKVGSIIGIRLPAEHCHLFDAQGKVIKRQKDSVA
jgi:multiple sugar transport system ATP-binding protein